MDRINEDEIESLEESFEKQYQSANWHPWRRYFARSVDFSFYAITWLCIQYFVFHWYPADNLFISLLINYFIILIAFIIEPILLCTWGTTPGKAVFGLVLSNRHGQKLTYGEALTRTFGVFGSGYGYGIPIYNLVRLYKSYKASKNGEKMPWDSESGYKYRLKDMKVRRIIIYIMSEILYVSIVFIIVNQSQMPPNRGDITPVQYYENINDILKRPDMQKGIYMDENGVWKDEYVKNNIWNDSASTMPKHELITKNGKVTGVRIEMNNEDNSSKQFVVPIQIIIQKAYITLAFYGAQKSVNCFEMNSAEIKSMLENTENFDIELNGVRIIQEIEQTGYMVINNDFWPQDSVEQKFKMVFSMELIP